MAPFAPLAVNPFLPPPPHLAYSLPPPMAQPPALPAPPLGLNPWGSAVPTHTAFDALFWGAGAAAAGTGAADLTSFSAALHHVKQGGGGGAGAAAPWSASGPVWVPGAEQGPGPLLGAMHAEMGLGLPQSIEADLEALLG